MTPAAERQIDEFVKTVRADVDRRVAAALRPLLQRLDELEAAQLRADRAKSDGRRREAR